MLHTTHTEGIVYVKELYYGGVSVLCIFVYFDNLSIKTEPASENDKQQQEMVKTRLKTEIEKIKAEFKLKEVDLTEKYNAEKKRKRSTQN